MVDSDAKRRMVLPADVKQMEQFDLNVLQTFAGEVAGIDADFLYVQRCLFGCTGIEVDIGNQRNGDVLPVDVGFNIF